MDRNEAIAAAAVIANRDNVKVYVQHNTETDDYSIQVADGSFDAQHADAAPYALATTVRPAGEVPKVTQDDQVVSFRHAAVSGILVGVVVDRMDIGFHEVDERFRIQAFVPTFGAMRVLLKAAKDCRTLDPVERLAAVSAGLLDAIDADPLPPSPTFSTVTPAGPVCLDNRLAPEPNMADEDRDDDGPATGFLVKGDFIRRTGYGNEFPLYRVISHAIRTIPEGMGGGGDEYVNVRSSEGQEITIWRSKFPGEFVRAFPPVSGGCDQKDVPTAGGPMEGNVLEGSPSEAPVWKAIHKFADRVRLDGRSIEVEFDTSARRKSFDYAIGGVVFPDGVHVRRNTDRLITIEAAPAGQDADLPDTDVGRRVLANRNDLRAGKLNHVERRAVVRALERLSEGGPTVEAADKWIADGLLLYWDMASTWPNSDVPDVRSTTTSTALATRLEGFSKSLRTSDGDSAAARLNIARIADGLAELSSELKATS